MTIAPTVRLRLFATARDAAGLPSDQFTVESLRDLLDKAGIRYGDAFVRVVRTAQVWISGEPAGEASLVLQPDDEVATIPPILGG